MSSADSLEQEEIRQKRKLLSQTSLINEEVNNYRREFFSMLEEKNQRQLDNIHIELMHEISFPYFKPLSESD